MKTAATITVNNPADMSPRGRSEIAAWMRKQAKNLVSYGKSYVKSKFKARYRYVERHAK